MNFNEIVEELKKIAQEKIEINPGLLEDYPYCNDETEYYKYMFADSILDGTSLGKVVEVHHKGGSGQGEMWELVLHFVDHNVYIKLEGYYSSYDGKDFSGDELFEVFPKDKMVTFYEEK